MNKCDKEVIKSVVPKKIGRAPNMQHPKSIKVFWSGRLDLNQRPLHPESKIFPKSEREAAWTDVILTL